MLQCRKYIGGVLRRIRSEYPDYEFSKACLVVAPDHAEIRGISGVGANLMRAMELPHFIAGMEKRRANRQQVPLNPNKLKKAFYLN